MTPDAIAALIAAISTVLVAVLPFAIGFLRAKGVVIKTEHEALARSAVLEGARFAEEYARKQPATSAENLVLATKYAESLMLSAGIKPGAIPVSDRVQAALPEMRASKPPTPPPVPRAKK